MKMNAIIQRIAKQHGVTPTEVEKQMQFAIQEAMKSTNPVAQAHWKKSLLMGMRQPLKTF